MFVKTLCFLAVAAAASASCISNINVVDGCNNGYLNGGLVGGISGCNNGLAQVANVASSAAVIAPRANQVISNRCQCVKRIVVPKLVSGVQVIPTESRSVQTGVRSSLERINYNYNPSLNAGPAIPYDLNGVNAGYGLVGGLYNGINAGYGLNAGLGLYNGVNAGCGLNNAVVVGGLNNGYGLNNLDSGLGLYNGINAGCGLNNVVVGGLNGINSGCGLNNVVVGGLNNGCVDGGLYNGNVGLGLVGGVDSCVSTC